MINRQKMKSWYVLWQEQCPEEDIKELTSKEKPAKNQ
tara:strand:+ start:727 stop:837 length:111 start_codon:yes stop_codon:yes gene_type:complete